MKLSGIGRTFEVLVVLCALVAGAFIPQLFFLSAAQGQNASAAQTGKRFALVLEMDLIRSRLSVRRLQTRKGSLSS